MVFKFPNPYECAKTMWNITSDILLKDITFIDFMSMIDMWSFPQISVFSGHKVVHQIMVLGIGNIGLFGVFMDNLFQYLLINPKKEFFSDLKDRFVVSPEEALSRY